MLSVLAEGKARASGFSYVKLLLALGNKAELLAIGRTTRAGIADQVAEEGSRHDFNLYQWSYHLSDLIQH